MCTAKVNDVEIPVKVTVQDDTTYAVNFVTTKKLVNLDKVGAMIAPDVSAKLRTRVTIDCGKGLKALEPGESFRCSAKDSDGGTGVLTYTIGKMDGADEWKIG